MGIRDSIVSFAEQQLGKPYVWGGTGPAGYDCSGLVYAAYKAAGGTGGHRTTAAQLGKAGTAVSVADALPGDIVYYDEPGATDHVGIYIGNGQMIDAPTFGKPVEKVGIGKPTSIRHEDLPGDSSILGKAADAVTGAVAGAVDAVNPFSNWQSDFAGLALKVVGACAAAALVIVGAKEALHDKGTQ